MYQDVYKRQPFINSLGMESINQGHSLNFGLARGMGSVAYACICYILGIITVKAGPVSIPITVIVLTLLSLGILILFPFSKAKSDSTATNAPKSSSDSNPILFFRKYKRFSLVLLGCCLLYTSFTELPELLLNGFHSTDVTVAAMLNGGGITSMLKVGAIVCISSSYSGIFQATGILNGFQKMVCLLANRTKPYFAVLVASILTSVMACNQTLAIMLTDQLCSRTEPDKLRFANNLEDSAVIIRCV